MANQPGLEIGALRGGGLVVGYRCSSRCRHCLYGCGPHRHDGETTDRRAIDRLLDDLARRAPRAAWHIGGGEPFLDVDRLEHVVSGLVGRGLALEYVETNGGWALEAALAESVLDRLARAGLRSVLVSLSPFHAEFVPFDRTKLLIAAADRVLQAGAFVWIPEFARELGTLAPGERLRFDEVVAAHGDEHVLAWTARYGLVTAGRAGRLLHRHGYRLPWAQAAARADCRRRLADTTHFHVDLEGNYVPGLCAGIVLPMAAVPGAIDLARFKVLGALVREGPAALVEMARGTGFEPHETYASACDLCTHVRAHLFAQGHAELGPAGFYDPRSVDFAPSARLRQVPSAPS